MDTQIATVGLNTSAQPAEPLELSRSNITGVSFETKLASEEKKLEEKQKLLSFVPWADIQNVFALTPLSFEFDLTQQKVEEPAELTSDDKRRAADSSSGLKRHPAQSPESAENKSYLSAKLNANIDTNLFLKNLIENLGYSSGNIYIPFNLSKTGKMSTGSIDLKLIVDEIVSKVKLVKEGQKVELSLALKPDELGELLMSVSMKNGLVSISISADPEAANLLKSELAHLIDQLTQANIRLGDLDVFSDGRSGENFRGMAAGPEMSFALQGISREEAAFSPIVNFVDRNLYTRLFGFIPEQLVYSKA